MTDKQHPFPQATISIYQNPDHVAGLLQQIHLAPLLRSETVEGGEDRQTVEGTTTKAAASAGVSAAVPFLGKVGADLSGDAAKSAESGLTSTSRLTRNFEYSQAYYLQVVRTALRSTGMLKTIGSSADASDLKSGDFVEYTASFRPNEIIALLDILTPDLIAEIARARVRSEGLAGFDAFAGDFDGLQTFLKKNAAKAEMQSELAHAIATAVRVDFRSEKTREFYGTIAPGPDVVTAITICDNAHFVVEDEDRILDGDFTVLGKVTSTTSTDVPMLERNKILERFKPEVVDTLFRQLRQSVESQARKLDAQGDDDLPDDFFDVAFSSRVWGASFKVIPIAIYA